MKNLTQGYFELEALNNYFNTINIGNLLCEVKPIQIIAKNEGNNKLIGQFIPVNSISTFLNKNSFNVLKANITTYIFEADKIVYIN